MFMYSGADKYEIVLDELECTLSIETLQYLLDEMLSKEEIYKNNTELNKLRKESYDDGYSNGHTDGYLEISELEKEIEFEESYDKGYDDGYKLGLNENIEEKRTIKT